MSISLKDKLELLYQNDIDLDNHELYLHSDIVSESSEWLIKGLKILQSEAYNPAVITISINSEGGDVYAGCAIYDAIKACPIPVLVYGTGLVCSAASFIFQAGDMRVLSPNATMMVHYGSGTMEDAHTYDFIKEGGEAKRLADLYTDTYLKRINEKFPNFTREQLYQKMAFNWYMAPAMAIKWGLADSITENIDEIKEGFKA